MAAGTRYTVSLTSGAEQDLDDIIGFVAVSDSPGKAAVLLDRIVEKCETLAVAPERGTWVPELLTLGIREYRQILFKPYRVIYQVIDSPPSSQAVVVVIADSRRSLRTLLERRLLDPGTSPFNGPPAA